MDLLTEPFGCARNSVKHTSKINLCNRILMYNKPKCLIVKIKDTFQSMSYHGCKYFALSLIKKKERKKELMQSWRSTLRNLSFPPCEIKIALSFLEN